MDHGLSVVCSIVTSSMLLDPVQHSGGLVYLCEGQGALVESHVYINVQLWRSICKGESNQLR